MLKEQLKNQIATEAEANTRDFKVNNDYQAGYIQGYKDGYEVGGERYGEKAQKAEEKAARYEKALKYIATFNLTSEADELDLSDAECGYNAIIETAREVVTPKTGEDENS